MEPIRITKVIKVGTSYGLVIPLALLESANLKRGDQVTLVANIDNSINIKKVTNQIII